jgi:hypothetical protein
LLNKRGDTLFELTGRVFCLVNEAADDLFSLHFKLGEKIGEALKLARRRL